MREYTAMLTEQNQQTLDNWVRIKPPINDFTPCLWFNVNSGDLWIEDQESREPAEGDFLVLDYFESLDLENHSVLLLTIESKLEMIYHDKDGLDKLFGEEVK